jgi:hypothetical protein
MDIDQPVVIPPEAVPVEDAAKPQVDVSNIRKQARYFGTHPEAAEIFLQEYDHFSGGKLATRVEKLELENATERALRQFGLTDEDRDLIEAPTAEAIRAKAEKLAKRNAATAKETAAAATESPPETKAVPEIVFPTPDFAARNPLEAAEEMLRRMS